MNTFLKISAIAAGMLAATVPTLSAASADASTPAPATTSPAPVGPRAKALRRAIIRHHLAKQLGLSSDQIAQLKSLRKSTAQTIKAIRADNSLTQEQRKAKIRETLASARTQMKSVLTPEQQSKLQEIRAKQHHGPNT